MKNRGSRSEEPQTDINISPLIDMVFILLIFFIVTTVFVEEPGVDVNKPRAVMIEDLEKNSILVAITADNKILFDDEEVGLGEVIGRVKANVKDAESRPIELPPEGLVMSRFLTEKLVAQRGDVLTVNVLDGRRPTLALPLVQTAEDYVGYAIYMQRDVLNRALGEGPVINSVDLTLDHAQRDAFFTAAKKSPLIQGIGEKLRAIEELKVTMEQNITIYTIVLALFAGSICFGVVYNAARIALSERGRELASLRVLGFTKAEVSYVLLGELGVLTVVALPLGCLLGFGLAALVSTAYNAELFRPPLLVTAERYASAVLYTIGFAAFSGWVVRRRIENLDLIVGHLLAGGLLEQDEAVGTARELGLEAQGGVGIGCQVVGHRLHVEGAAVGCGVRGAAVGARVGARDGASVGAGVGAPSRQ